MKRLTRKLALRADTLRTLRVPALTRAAGGVQCGTTSAICPNSCWGTCVSCDCQGTD